MIRDALELIAAQWDSATRQLLFDGAGPGSGMLCKAFNMLSNNLGVEASKDVMRGAFHGFAIDNSCALDAVATRAIEATLETVIGEIGTPNRASCVADSHINQTVSDIDKMRVNWAPAILRDRDSD
jgi:hypothetical protein